MSLANRQHVLVTISGLPTNAGDLAGCFDPEEWAAAKQDDISLQEVRETLSSIPGSLAGRRRRITGRALIGLSDIACRAEFPTPLKRIRSRTWHRSVPSLAAILKFDLPFNQAVPWKTWKRFTWNCWSNS